MCFTEMVNEQWTLHVPENFRRRDTMQQGAVSFQYDDVSRCFTRTIYIYKQCQCSQPISFNLQWWKSLTVEERTLISDIQIQISDIYSSCRRVEISHIQFTCNCRMTLLDDLKLYIYIYAHVLTLSESFETNTAADLTRSDVPSFRYF